MFQITLPSFFVAICVATLAAEVAAELKASRPETDAAPIPAPATAESPANSPLVVRLQRIDGGNNSHFYVGRLSVGKPAQEFQVLFDTASGHVLLPHQSCSSPACKKHRQYNPWKTESAMDVNVDGKAVQEGVRLMKGKTPRDAISVEFAQADLGDGAAQAVLVRDDVCVGTEFSGQVCTKVDMMAAIKLDDELFDMMPYDGMLGLGLAGLSSESGCTYFSRLMESHPGLLPQFGLSLGAQSGEIYFGGHDSSRMASPLEWFPVLHPDDGFWEVTVKAVRLGNVTVDACEDGCRGIVDTGASRLGVQEDNFDDVHAALARAAPMVGGGCQGADLEFDLGSLSLKLRVEDYAAGAACEPQLGPLDLDSKEYKGVYAFGETVLRRYYTAFDWQGRRIGFAPVASRRVRLGGSRAASSEREFTV
eukprot:TRINITY_DN3920_c0_g1_i5.p1 TRINITY_DN3920_c0_g1~~TRINITY_DN3920_c0_g1_i5.p1  ORF type:complete len:421 (+),score=128.85 TRINITY_DN3920_c0_g1_i5:61-1323(+)